MSVEPIPFDGAAPQRVLVLPPRSIDPDAPESELTTELIAVLSERGYDAVAADAGLANASAATWEECAALARDAGADAVLSLRVERWDAAWGPGLVRLAHDLGYRLWDVERPEHVLWELRLRDDWRFDAASQGFEPATSVDDYLGRTARRPDRSPYRNRREIARAIHRRALAYLPAGSGSR